MLIVSVLGALALLLLLATVPRWLLRRSQDRLARESFDREGQEAFKLLTRADLVVGRYRRAPGVLGLTQTAISFQGVFGESVLLATSRIQKIATGRRLSSGRLLVRLEVLRLTPPNGAALEFVLTPASASAWRNHLALWAARERQADADQVTPGRG